jgi:hypothetical protein
MFDLDDKVITRQDGKIHSISDRWIRDSVNSYTVLDDLNVYHECDFYPSSKNEVVYTLAYNSDFVVSLAKYYIQAVPECQMLSSAELCYLDACSLFEKGNYKDAGIRALKSLAYTIGKSHPDYIICQAKTE